MPDAYAGLPWSAEPKRNATLATSPATTLRYAVRFDDPDRIEALVFAPLGAGAPAPSQRLGIFKDLELAVLACERHDFGFAASVSPGLVFSGSEGVVRWAEALRAEGALDDDPDSLLDLLLDGPKTPNGRPFHRAASFLPARKTALKQERDGGLSLTVSVEPHLMPIWLVGAKPGSELVLGVVESDGGSEPDAWRERAAAAFTRSHTLHNDPVFQEWLGTRYDRWGLVAAAAAVDSDAVASAVLETLKRLLGVASRRTLRANRDAVERLEAIDSEYYRDLSQGFGVSAA